MRVTKIIGFQQFTSNTLNAALGVSTALLKDAQGQVANAAIFSCFATTGAIRFRSDGTAPTATVGMRIVTGIEPYLYQGDLHKLQFISEGGNAEMNVTYVQAVD